MANLIASLYPFDDERYKVVETLIDDAKHTPRFVPHEVERQGPGRWSRETTAAPESEDETDNTREMGSLQLRFDDLAYKNGQGITFGWHSQRCDIVLPRLKGISKEHCYLTYDDNNRLVLKDRSSAGTVVTYDGLGGRLKRRFTWILGGDRFTDDTKVITIQIHKCVKFQIVVPKHDVYSYTYIDNVAAFHAQMEELRESLQMNFLDIDSRATTLQAASRDEAQIFTGAQYDPSGTKTPVPTTNSIVLTRKHLGTGSFGRVDHVWDVSTGLEYARKYLVSSDTSDWANEAENMKYLKHPNIVQLKTILLDGPKPGLYLEFVPMGTLQYQYYQEPLSTSELEQTLLQGLSALEYLHGNSFVHRDIKPENILVMSRAPLHIKLADFGLSKASKSLYTFCGTPQYAAPEIVALQGQSRSSRMPYTTAVDIWSLGVVILECGYYLPNYPQTVPGTLALDWPELLIRTLDHWDPEGFDVLYNMLVLDPLRRGSASACLQQIHQERALCRGWTAINDRPAGGSIMYTPNDEEATQVLDYAAIEHSHTTLTPYDRNSSRQQWGDPTKSVSVHDSEIDAYIDPDPPRADSRSTIIRAHYLEADASHDNPNALNHVKKRAKSSRSTPSTAVPSDRRPRRRRRKSDSTSAYDGDSTHSASALALYEKDWLEDPNWVGASVVAMGQPLDPDWSNWSGASHATGFEEEHANVDDYPSDVSDRNPSRTTPDAEYFMYFLNNAIQNAGH